MAIMVRFDQNAKLEYEKNKERYEFLRWGQLPLTI